MQQLTLSWRVLLSYRNQSIDLQSKSMDWFLYDNCLRHERVNCHESKKNRLHFLIFISKEVWSITPTSFSLSQLVYYCTLFYPFRPNPGRREKINWNFYFQTLLWCLKRVYKGLKGLYKTFWSTTKKCKNKNLS